MKFTIYGNPIKHSKSPQMHNAGFRYINFNGIYTKTLLKDGKNLKENFLQNNIKGANITVPYKEDAYNQADEVIGLAQKIGAVNTYINEDGKIKAYNTDANGFIMAIKEFGNIKSTLVLGAGGTARAIAVALKNENIKTTILNRSKNRLSFFYDLGCDIYNWNNFKLDKYDLVINSTSAGLKDDNYPISKEILRNIFDNSFYAFDCIYGKSTPFLQLAKKLNLKYKNGEDMLLYQGVLAFELFTNTQADNYLIDIMRNSLRKN
jgi:shikimate dehydrogenase